MHRSRSRRRETHRGFSVPLSYDTSADEASSKARGDLHTASPDPVQHAQALVESFGARTALQISQFNAQLTRADGSYWKEVFENVVEAWGAQRC